MPKLIAFTQYHENYGAHDWDGKGECPQYWKAKGGSSILVAQMSWEEAATLGSAGLKALVDKASAAGMEQKDDYSNEYVIDWSLEGDDWTEFGEEPIDFWAQKAKEDELNLPSAEELDAAHMQSAAGGD